MNEEEIKKIVKDFFEKSGFKVQIQMNFTENLVFSIEVKTDEPQLLIGENGEVLLDIQHLLKIILRKKLNEKVIVDLDINEYKKKKIKYLKELAKNLADEVVLTKKEKILPPMPAYERRIIHLELASRGDVTTESIGKEPERRVIIKPYP